MLRYQDFTKRKAITKTIRFRLFPCQETEQYLKERNAMENDLRVQQDLEELKQILDFGIRDIAEQTLRGISFDFTELINARDQSEKEYNKVTGKLRKSVEKALMEAMPRDNKPKRIDSKQFLIECIRKYSQKSDNSIQFETEHGKSDDMSEAKYTILLHLPAKCPSYQT